MARRPKDKKRSSDEEKALRELIFIQGARLEDIRELKRYQWQSTYYSVLAVGGLVALSRLTMPGWPYRLALMVGCALVVVAWQLINNAIERALARSRAARDKVYDLFTPQVRRTRITDPADRMEIYRVLRIVVIGSATIAAITIAT
jgi:hypothetical protein